MEREIYVKINSEKETELLIDHYNNKNWSSIFIDENSYCENSFVGLKFPMGFKHIKKRTEFPYYVEYKDNFKWNQAGSYLSMHKISIHWDRYEECKIIRCNCHDWTYPVDRHTYMCNECRREKMRRKYARSIMSIIQEEEKESRKYFILLT